MYTQISRSNDLPKMKLPEPYMHFKKALAFCNQDWELFRSQCRFWVWEFLRHLHICRIDRHSHCNKKQLRYKSSRSKYYLSQFKTSNWNFSTWRWNLSPYRDIYWWILVSVVFLTSVYLVWQIHWPYNSTCFIHFYPAPTCPLLKCSPCAPGMKYIKDLQGCQTCTCIRKWYMDYFIEFIML